MYGRDHYDGLVDRPDFLRQSTRLRAGLLPRRGLPTPDTPPSQSDVRASLARAIVKVVVLPHPRGTATSHLDWARRSAVLALRLAPGWA